VTIPTLMSLVCGLLGSIYDGVGTVKPPGQFKSWEALGRLIGFGVGMIVYPIALIAVYR
jgi:hypothetical protein